MLKTCETETFKNILQLKCGLKPDICNNADMVQILHSKQMK